VTVLNFDVSQEMAESAPVVRVNGEIDIHTCPNLTFALEEATGHVTQKILVLNLEKVAYIDSTGLGTIAHHAHKMNTKGYSIYVICNQPQVKKIFDVSGLGKKNIKLFVTEKEALASISPRG